MVIVTIKFAYKLFFFPVLFLLLCVKECGGKKETHHSGKLKSQEKTTVSYLLKLENKLFPEGSWKPRKVSNWTS